MGCHSCWPTHSFCGHETHLHVSITSDLYTGDHLTTTTPPQSPQTPGQTVDALEIPQADVGDVAREAISQLRQEVKHLEMNFEYLLQATSAYLEKKTPIQTITRSLYVHRASDTETDIDLVAGHRHEIREADTVGDLFDILSAGKC